MITTLVRRVMPLVGLTVLLVGIMRTQRVPQADGDMWFHLRLGREFLDGWSLAHPGHLGPFDTADWSPTQWLPQEGMAWVAEHWGVDTVVWVMGMVPLVIIGFLYASCRSFAAPLPAAVAVTLGTLAASPGFTARPQMLSYLFIVLTTSAWLATYRDGRPRYWLVAVAWIWPMCHGMWPVGISISVAAVLGLALDRRADRRALAVLALIPAASLVVAVLTPVGLSSFRALLVVGGRSEYFAEWGPTDFTAPRAAVLVAMLIVVIAGGLRSRPIPWTQVALVVLAIGWGLYTLRTTAVAALILTPLVAMALGRLVPAAVSASRREHILVATITACACAVLLPVVKMQPSEPVVPSWVDERLDAVEPGTRILNGWDTGSYFLYRHPDLALVMHGYGDVFTDVEIKRNFDLESLKPGWDKAILDLDVDAAILDPDTPLGYAVQHLMDWTVVEADESFVLLKPPDTSPTPG